MVQRLCLPVLAGLVLSSITSAQVPLLKPCGGAIGKPIKFEITGGPASKLFLFLTSLQRGNFPLSAIDPGDTRRLGVGLDLLSILVVLPYDSMGGAKFALPLPNLPALAGKALLHQVLSFPGTRRVFGPMSEVAVVPMEPGGKMVLGKNAMLQARSFDTDIPLGDGRHLIVGGGVGGLLSLTSTKTTEIYDVATRSFSRGPDMSIERGVHTSTRLRDGRYMIIGGVNIKNDPQKSTEIYTPSTGKFAPGPSLLTQRMGHTATLLLDGRVLVTGGLADLNGTAAKVITTALNTTEIYDPRTKTWTAGPTMSAPRAGHSAIRLPNGRVLIMGGVSWFTFFIKLPTIIKTCEIFDPVQNKLTLAKAMIDNRATFTSAMLDNGLVLVAGGPTTVTAPNPTKKAELYDYKTDKWLATGAMSSERALAGQGMLPDGSLAVLGGAQGSIATPTAISGCERYDSASKTWKPLPKLNTARAGGLVLVLGACGLDVLGGNAGTTGFRTHELYLQ